VGECRVEGKQSNIPKIARFMCLGHKGLKVRGRLGKATAKQVHEKKNPMNQRRISPQPEEKVGEARGFKDKCSMGKKNRNLLRKQQMPSERI